MGLVGSEVSLGHVRRHRLSRVREEEVGQAVAGCVADGEAHPEPILAGQLLLGEGSVAVVAPHAWSVSVQGNDDVGVAVTRKVGERGVKAVLMQRKASGFGVLGEGAITVVDVKGIVDAHRGIVVDNGRHELRFDERADVHVQAARLVRIGKRNAERQHSVGFGKFDIELLFGVGSGAGGAGIQVDPVLHADQDLVFAVVVDVANGDAVCRLVERSFEPVLASNVFGLTTFDHDQGIVLTKTAGHQERIGSVASHVDGFDIDGRKAVVYVFEEVFEAMGQLGECGNHIPALFLKSLQRLFTMALPEGWNRCDHRRPVVLCIFARHHRSPCVVTSSSWPRSFNRTRNGPLKFPITRSLNPFPVRSTASAR